MNGADILVGAVLAALIALAIALTRRSKKWGGCSCGCSGCAKNGQTPCSGRRLSNR